MNRNFYLYFSNNMQYKIYEKNNIYCFKNNKIVAVDKHQYDRKKRYEFQKKYNVSPYYISQQVLKEILICSLDNPNLLHLRKIEFIDDYIEELPEFEYLENLIMDKKNIEIYDNVMYILNEYDTEIYKIKFRYKEFDFSVSTQGVLDVAAPSKILKDFIMDSMANKLLLGLTI